MVDSVLVLHVRDENHLGVAPAHLLQGLQVSDLHRGLAVEFVSSHPHQLGCFDVGTGRDNLAFGQPPLLGGRRQRILEIFAQLDILDENLFDIDSPLLDVLVDLLLDVVCDLLPFFKEVLQDKLSAGVLQDGVGDLRNGLTEVLNSVVGVARVDDSVIDSCVDVYRNVVFRNDVLTSQIQDVDLGANHAQSLGAGVYVV